MASKTCGSSDVVAARFETDKEYISGLKYYMAEKLKAEIPAFNFNGDTFVNSLYTVLNVSFPKTEKSEMILFNLDINGICASGGSACTSGADLGSHVIRAVNNNPNLVAVRFSFGRQNTREEVDFVVEKLKGML